MLTPFAGSRALRETPRAWQLAGRIAFAFLALVCLTTSPLWSTVPSGTDWVEANEPIIFSVVGDVPYGTNEIPEFQQQIDQHDLYSPSEFLTHVGDIKSGSEACTADRYSVVADILKSSQVPCYIVPGDNETTDCSNPSTGMSLWNQYFLRIDQNWPCSPTTERQSGRQENFAFVRKGMLFVGINLVGGSNSTSIMEDDADWVVLQLQSKASQVRGAVIFSQAGPGSNHSTFFNPFVTAAQSFGKPILFIHGDGHSWIQDHPFSASNILRVQVENGASEQPLQVTATLDNQNLFQLKRNPWANNPTPVTRPPCGTATPTLTIADSSVLEGSSGTTTMLFNVTLANPNGSTVTVQYATANGTATAGSDYTATSGSLSFSGSTTSRTISVSVTGDLTAEPDETFFVDLSNPSNATLGDSRAQGTIRTDDGNRVPTARSDDYATNEDVVLNVSAPGVLGNDSDPDGDPLTASIQSTTSFGTLNLSANGSFTYTPSANFSGSDEFTYVASDGRGGTATAAVTLSINPVNDAPVASGETYTTPVGTPLVVAAPGLLGNDADVDGDELTIQLISWPQFGSLVLGANGSFTYTPVAAFDGVDSFTYRVRDAATSSNTVTTSIGVGGPVSTTFNPLADTYVSSFKPSNNYGTASELRVRAGSRNERPYLRFQVTGFRAVRAAHLRLWVTDSSPQGGGVYSVANTYNGTTTTWTETGLFWNNAPALPASPRGSFGAVNSGTWVELDLTSAIPGDGTYCFAIASTSTDVARYTSREGTNKPQLVIERGNVSGVPGNQQPTANTDSYNATEDVALVIAAPGVLGNDSDPDGDALVVTEAGSAAHGSVSVQTDGGFTYTPAANYSGSDSFTYTVSDNRGGGAVGNVTLAVAAVNDAPVATADTYNVTSGGVLSIAAPGVLANDSDVEGSALSAVQVTGPGHGTLTLNANGSFTYTPAGNYSGPDSFTYRASDGSATSTVTTVSITVGSPAGPVTFVEAQSGGAAASATVSTAAGLGGAPGDLYLAGVAAKGLRTVTNVSGLGLTWTRVRAQCGGRSQTMVELWMARGTPSPGIVTATLSSAPDNAVITVARYANSHATNPLGNVVSGNTNGVSGTCANGIDGSSFSFPLTTQGGVVFGCTAQRSHSLVPGSGWTQRADSRSGTSGTAASLTCVEKASTAGTTTFDGTFTGVTDWAAAAVEIRPNGASTKAIAAGPSEPETEVAITLDRVFPNPARHSATIAYELPSPALVEVLIFNARGQRVRQLQNGLQTAGRYMLHWDTRDNAGVPVPAGIYFVRADFGYRMLKQKLVLQR